MSLWKVDGEATSIIDQRVLSELTVGEEQEGSVQGSVAEDTPGCVIGIAFLLGGVCVGGLESLLL